MILSTLLTVATAILLPASLVIAAPGAPSNPQALNHRISPLVAQDLTPTASSSRNEFARCKFHARISEKCEGPEPGITVLILWFTDNAGNVINRPADGDPVMVDDNMRRTTGLGPGFWAEVYEVVMSRE